MIALSVLFFLFGISADIVSSINLSQDFEETNPFARNVDHSFNVKRAIVGKSILFVDISLLAAVLFFGIYRVNGDWAALAASVPFLYIGFISLAAASYNFLIRLGYFAP
jgi:hypothetical protein